MIVILGFQTMVRVRDPPVCAICEAVMKQLETMLEDKTTEVTFSFWCDLTVALVFCCSNNVFCKNAINYFK